MQRISFITTCKGRLEHLKKTLPRLLANKPDEVIVVDASCPDGTASWIRSQNLPVKIVQIDMEGFHLAKARNVGARAATCPALCFFDADILIDQQFIPWIKHHWHGHSYAVRAQKSAYDGIHEQGTVVCRADDFILVGGYDEVFDGYGGEDHDLYEKLRRSGLRRQNFPQKMISSLPHDSALRTQFSAEKDIKISSIQNRLYASAKRQILSLFPSQIELPISVRKKIKEQIKANIKAWKKGNKKFTPVKLSISKSAWLPPPYKLSQTLQIELQIHDAENQDISRT
jgi:glycosyltransferase involved in cell wall biosynthesis